MRESVKALPGKPEVVECACAESNTKQSEKLGQKSNNNLNDNLKRLE
jgi:hypothetical protein